MRDGDEPRLSLPVRKIFGATMRCRTTVEAADQFERSGRSSPCEAPVAAAACEGVPHPRMVHDFGADPRRQFRPPVPG